MADEPAGAATSRQPTWGWVLLLGLPGALIASAIAKGRGLRLRREVWAAGGVISGVGVVLVVLVLALTGRSSPPNLATTGSGAAVPTFDDSSARTPFVNTPTPAPGASLTSTDTATWQDDRGYSFQATVMLGHLAPYQSGMRLTGPQGQGPLVAGRACQLAPGVDAVLPLYVDLTNTTATYSSDIPYNITYGTLQMTNPQYPPATPAPVWGLYSGNFDQVPWTEYSTSAGPSCASDTNGIQYGLTCNQVQPQHACWGLFFVILKNYYSPNHPSGDTRQLEQLGVELVVRRNAAATAANDFPNSMTGPDVTCDGQGNCAIPLKGFAS
jgi:hypothetical protein